MKHAGKSLQRGVVAAIWALLVPIGLPEGLQSGPPAGVQGQSPGLKLPVLGANVATYQFSDQRARSVFGNLVGIGPGLGPVFGGRDLIVRPELAVLRGSNNGNKAALVFFGGQIRYSLVEPIIATPQPNGPPQLRVRDVTPYVAASVNLMYADLSARSARVSTKVLGYSASLAAGVSFGGNVFLEARYRFTTTISDFDLSGTQLTLGLRF